MNGNFAATGGTTFGGGITVSDDPATTKGTQFPTISFWSQSNRAANNTYPNSSTYNGFTLTSGTKAANTWFAGSLLNNFPGDAPNNVTASNTYLYNNGNVFNGKEYLIWGQTLTNLVVGRYYTFYAYVNNAIEPPVDAPYDPVIRLRTGGDVALPDGSVVQGPLTLTEAATASAQPLGGWQRIAYTFKADATSQIFKVTSSAGGINGDDFQMTQVNVVENQPTLTINNNTTICAGNSLTLTATTAAANLTYAWTGPNGFASNQKSPTINNLQPSNSGTYTLTVTGEGGMTNTKSFILTVNVCADARNDAFVAIPGLLTTTASILSNDIVNNTTASSANSTFSVAPGYSVPAGLTLNSDGTITVPANMAPGVYEIVYRLCSTATPQYCDIASAVVSIKDLKDSDGDGVIDSDDLDDDNDGILDIAENICDNFKNILTENFGSGTTRNSIPWTSYCYEDGTGFSSTNCLSSNQGSNINDGEYAVANLTGVGGFGTWINVRDHTGNTDGKMMVVNASLDPGEFYRRALSVPYGQTDIRFGVWVLNLIRTGLTPYNKPDIRIELRTMDDQLIAVANPSPIDQDEQWHYISATLNNGNNTSFYIIIRNDGPGGNGNDLAIDDITVDYRFCDYDGDSIPNHLDVDSDNDDCPDAIEGSETVTYNQVFPLTFSSSDPNYTYRGQIKVIYDGKTVTPSRAALISQSAAALGVPQLVNNAGNNMNTAINPSNLAAVADNTDGTADVGQGIGTSQNAALKDTQECGACYKPAMTAGTALSTNHGITSLQRAGASTLDNWPMVRKGAYTVLEADTKGFVINRLTTAQINKIVTDGKAVEGMAAYDTTVNCLKIYDGTSFKCYSTPSCD